MENFAHFFSIFEQLIYWSCASSPGLYTCGRDRQFSSSSFPILREGAGVPLPDVSDDVNYKTISNPISIQTYVDLCSRVELLSVFIVATLDE